MATYITTEPGGNVSYEIEPVDKTTMLPNSDADASQAVQAAQAAARAAQEAAAGVAESAEQIAQNAEDITDLKDALTDMDDKIAASLITNTASGAIASFPDGADNVPVESLVVDIAPVQEGTGDPSPENIRPISGWTGANVVRTGKNLFDETLYRNLMTVYEYISGSYRCRKIQLAPNTSYTVSQRSGTAENVLILLNNNAQVNVSGFFDFRLASGTKTYTTDSTGCLYIGTYTDGDSAYNARLALCKLQIEEGPQATAYEEYKGQTYSITFPTEAGTVYGGTLDVTTGVLTVDRAMVDLGTLDYAYLSDYGFFTKLPLCKANTTNAICSLYPLDTRRQDKTFRFWLSLQASGVMSLAVMDSAYSSPSDFKTGMSGVMLVYELAIPITYQLTTTEVSTLLGLNNIWADCGDINVDYRADTKLYIENLTAPTEDDMTANTNIPNATYFMVGNTLYLSTTTIPAGDTINPGTNCKLMNLASALNALNA